MQLHRKRDMAENIDTVSLPPGMISLVAQTRDPVLRETFARFRAAQSFGAISTAGGRSCPTSGAPEHDRRGAAGMAWPCGRRSDQPADALELLPGFQKSYRRWWKMLSAAHPLSPNARSRGVTSRQLPEVLQAVTF